jgi:hypothetical protein
MTFARSGPEHIKQIGRVTDFMHSLQCGDHAARLGTIELVQNIQMHINTKAFHSLNTSQCLTVRRSSDIIEPCLSNLHGRWMCYRASIESAQAFECHQRYLASNAKMTWMRRH